MNKKMLILNLCIVGITTMALTHSKFRMNVKRNIDLKYSEKSSIPDFHPYLNIQDNNLANQSQSKIQVVFALDCTGSMGGLIQAAKDKIWSIATGMSQAETQPDISFGFVFYRDIGDQFVTKRIELTNDMDSAYHELMDMQANGGGDMPESVNQALYESINHFKWDKDTNVYKVVFLVGDAPPHMDYKNDVKYPETCKMAVKKDIIINTIQCGSIYQTTPIWQDIAKKTKGEFLQLSQTGSEIVIKCPQDEEISRLMSIIDQTRIYYGSSIQRTQMETKVKAGEKIKSSTGAEIQAKRAAYNYSNVKNNLNYMGNNELISDILIGKIKIENIKTEELPENMKKMTLEERKKHVDEMIKKRKEAETNLAIKIKERELYVEKETAKMGEDTLSRSFSAQVHKVVVKQAQTKKIIIDKKIKN